MERITWAPSTADSRQAQVIEAATDPAYYITTFRKGPKWLRPELVGERIELFDEKTQKVFATGLVLAVKYTPFQEINAEDYFGQPQPNITTDEMLQIMRNVYGGHYENDTLTTVVTLGNLELV